MRGAHRQVRALARAPCRRQIEAFSASALRACGRRYSGAIAPTQDFISRLQRLRLRARAYLKCVDEGRLAFVVTVNLDRRSIFHCEVRCAESDRIIRPDVAEYEEAVYARWEPVYALRLT
jgi:hypothetical protein